MHNATFVLFILSLLTNVRAQANCTLRASGGDDSPQIKEAFRSCPNVVIPEDQNLLLGTALDTTGLERTHIRLLGTITLRDDVEYWHDNAFNVSYQNNSVAWMLGGKDIVLDGEGKGTIFGNGQTFYDARIENDDLRPPHLLLPYLSDNLVIRNLKIRQSPRWTILIHSSRNVLIHDLDIRSRSDTWALGRESNRETDGVDIYNSSYVTIHNLRIDNGDDCVSFKPNATNVFISDIWCNGTHGVSIGSLGEYDGVKDIVQNIYVNNVTIENSENGPRIKTWAGANRGYGNVDQVVFSNFQHLNNDSPLTIDNCYKTNADECLANPSNVTVSNIYFNNQYGTASGKFGGIGAAMVCSTGRCSNIHINNLNVTAPSECGPTVYANHHVNIQGNAAYKFTSDAKTYGAGGIKTDNSTNEGVTCLNGKVVTNGSR
ncbi:exopolygalacturonase [Moniliophthora roreri MCA 2997]|uniref:galacturonan 1,4-alpha-galacturonidase n=2 Tax=Moniliophthora roreri TaxID=221103 RepID=V2Y7V3_MONRO|nr:exopolygalacturonase [Moniliophthora roreri MCA 2997]KAI3619286.1 exopolygalacturonase [Moniliophthora roreri]